MPPKNDKPGNGGGGGGGGGDSTEFAVWGLTDASDGTLGTSADDTTSEATGFEIEGILDTAAGIQALHYTFTLSDGSALTLDIDDNDPTTDLLDLLDFDAISGIYTYSDSNWLFALDGGTGDWTLQYVGGTPVPDGSVQVDASYDVVHPKNGKIQTKTASPYTFTVDAPDAPNNPATISENAGAAQDYAVTEAGGVANGTLNDPEASGDLDVSDPDDGEAVFANPAALAGAYGTFTFDVSTGAWTYTLDQTLADSLIDGEPATDILTVTSADGTASHEIVVSITGANDEAAISENPAAAQDYAVTEAGGVDNGTPGDPDASGDLDVSDVDDGEAEFQTASAAALAGDYGTFTFNASTGAWTYTLDQALADSLNEGEPATDTLTVTSADGTASRDIVVTITGADDTASEPDPVFTPTDELYAEQWHLAMLGDMERIWAEYRGTSVSVGIYDDGIEYDHVDLDDNYDASKHLGFDPYPTDSSEGRHGTAVAGVIASEANGIGTVGVAPEASLTMHNIFTGAAAIGQSGFTTVINAQDQYDVVNHSWGFVPTNGWFQNDTNATVAGIRDSFTDAAVNGRGGRGTNIVMAAGNDADTAQGDYLHTSRHVILVAAHDSDPDASYYTNRGANILLSAPSSGYTAGGDLRVPTTDRQGEFGYVPDDWSDSSNGFGGTSSASPTVAGVVALMLDANPDLGWRDVQSILATSARHIGSEVGSPSGTELVPVDSDDNFSYDSLGVMPIEYDSWQYNGASNVNGGGLHVSGDYGAGSVDGYSAVRMAEVWTLFAPAQTSANEATASTGTFTPGLSVSGNGDSATWEFTYSGPAMELEYVEIPISLSANYFEEVVLTLESPSGTTVTLMEPIVSDYTAPPAFFIFGYISQIMTWTFGANSFRGEDPNGTWTVTLEEQNATYDTDNYGMEASGITLNEIGLDFYGKADGQFGVSLDDDVYHYTDEVFDVLVDEPGRLTLSDTAGEDWLNMAAMQGDLAVDLASDGSGEASDLLAGQFVAIGTGTVIENAVCGDGDDTLLGNDGVNRLHGMRGNDDIWGGAGNDELAGGAGADTFFFDALSDDDIVLDFTQGADLVSIDDAFGTDFSDIAGGFSDSGADKVLTLSNSCTITFAGGAGWTFTESDFVFQESTLIV